jgi:ribosome modulation factor
MMKTKETKMEESVFSLNQLEDAKSDGYRAYQDGQTSSDNPYNNNEEWDLMLAWHEGYSDAAWDD